MKENELEILARISALTKVSMARALLGMKSIKQSDIARSLVPPVSTQAVNAVVHGIRPNPRIREAIAAFGGCEVSDLWPGTKETDHADQKEAA